MQLVKPNELARVLGISTDALKKRRHRVTKSSNSDTPIGASNFTVTDTGRVLYIFDELPPDVRDNVEKLGKTGTKLTHEQRMKSSFRYANSLGKVNERKKRLHQAEVDKRAKELLEKEKADGVICVDVVEHIPEGDVINFIEELFKLSNKFVFIVIACYPAKKTLPDGRNVHLCIKSVQEWKIIIEDIKLKFSDISPYVICATERKKFVAVS